MGNKSISIDDQLWEEFLDRVGRRQASEKIREFIEDFTETESESVSVINRTPFDFYKCSLENCGSFGRLSGFDSLDYWIRRCLWCGNRKKETFKLIYSAGQISKEPKKDGKEGEKVDSS